MVRHALLHAVKDIAVVYGVSRPRDPSNPIRVTLSFKLAYVMFEVVGYKPEHILDFWNNYVCDVIVARLDMI